MVKDNLFHIVAHLWNQNHWILLYAKHYLVTIIIIKIVNTWVWVAWIFCVATRGSDGKPTLSITFSSFLFRCVATFVWIWKNEQTSISFNSLPFLCMAILRVLKWMLFFLSLKIYWTLLVLHIYLRSSIVKKNGVTANINSDKKQNQNIILLNSLSAQDKQ